LGVVGGPRAKTLEFFLFLFFVFLYFLPCD
jgi:hypothetical protein